MIDPNIQKIIDSNKKFKEPLKREKKVHRDIVVKYLQCTHTQAFKSDDPKAPAWVLGAERVDGNGRTKAIEVYGECPDCINAEVDAATTVSTRDANSDPGKLQTRDTTASS